MRKNTKSNKFLGRLLITLALLAALLAAAFIALWRPAPIDEPVRIYIPSGSTFDDVVYTVKAHSCVVSVPLFRAASRFVSYTEHVKSGSYVVSPNMGVLRLVYKLYRGNQDPVRLTISNTRTVGQLCDNIGSHIELSADTLRRLLADDSVCGSYGFNPETVIAMFQQNTYEVYWNIGATQFLNRMHGEYEAFWNVRRTSKCDKMNLTPVEVITLASIVEEETRQDDEKSTIASVYLNRLHVGMPLQADPTVKFAVGDFALRRITNAHLQSDSPYNTYAHKGLPPGPICIPGVRSIDAVLENRKTNFLYFCAREDFSGHHRFAASFAEHQRNAARYHKALNARGIK